MEQTVTVIEGVESTTIPEVTPASDQSAKAQPEGTEKQAIIEDLQPYTKEEIEEIVETKGVLDKRRMTPDQQALHQTFESYWTPRYQEASRIMKKAEEMLAKAQPEKEEPYFKNEDQNRVFTNEFLPNPEGFLDNISYAVTQAELVPPKVDDDGNYNKEYVQARQNIAYWMGIKDKFMLKREEVKENKRIAETVKVELGDQAKLLEAFAVASGFTAKEFRVRPEIRSLVKRQFDLATSAKTADTKEIKPTAQKLSIPGGVSGVNSQSPDSMTTSEFIRKRNEESAKRR